MSSIAKFAFLTLFVAFLFLFESCIVAQDYRYLAPKSAEIETEPWPNFGNGSVPIVQPYKKHKGFWLDYSYYLMPIIYGSPIIYKENPNVTFVAILGFERGKRFFLNFMLRYWTHQYGQNNSFEIVNSADWLDPNILLDNKFDISGQTKGIRIWTEPFLVRNSNNGEDFILLMDLQGMSEATSAAENAFILSIAAMFSSTLIYCVEEIKPSDLQMFEFIAKNVQLPMEGQNGTKNVKKQLPPFESLLFLVHNWANPKELKFGFEGGKQYLAQHLTAKDNDTVEMRKLRENIGGELFESVQCFLMPSPGKMATESNFTGNLTDIDGDFLAQMRVLMPALFENRRYRPIGNHEWLINLRSYFEVLNRDNMPLDVEKVVEAMAEVSNEIAKKKALRVYMQLIVQKEQFLGNWSEKKWLEWSNECEGIAIKSFFEVKKIGDANLTEHFFTELRQQIKQMYNAITTINRLKPTIYKKLSELYDQRLQIQEEIDQLVNGTQNHSEAIKLQIGKKRVELEMIKVEIQKTSDIRDELIIATDEYERAKKFW